MSHDTTSTEHNVQHTAPQAEHHGASHGEGKFSFDLLLNELGDHHELNLFFGKWEILPVILVDDGLHVYANAHAMEEAGMFTMHHPDAPHQIVHTTKKNAEGKPDTPSLDLSVTNFVAYQFIAIALVLTLFSIARGRYRKNPVAAPRGIQNVLESVVLYVRDQIVGPNVGTEKRTDRLMPYMMTLFFFILTLNLVGLLPGWHAATGALSVTMALALTTFFVVNFIAFKDAGVGSWFKHLLGGAPLYIAPIMVPIEIVGLITKPFALMIRLFANMTAGHIVLMSLVGLIFFFAQEMGVMVGWGVAPVSVLFSVFIYLLELLVAFLQAYIFTMLASVFVGLALGDHARDDHHAHGH